MPKKSELKPVIEQVVFLGVASESYEVKATEPKICTSLTPEQLEKRQKIFLDKYGFLLKQFAKLTTLTECREFLTHHWEFVCEEAVIAMKSIAKKLAEEQKDTKTALVQCLAMRFIMNIMENESIVDMRRCIMMFFERVHMIGSPYFCTFIIDLGDLIKTTREDASKKMAKTGSVKSEETKSGVAKPENITAATTKPGTNNTLEEVPEEVKTNGVELETELVEAADEEAVPEVAEGLQSSKK